MAKYSPEETYETRETYDKPKQSFSQWIENIWYHYKWTIILGGIVLAFVVIALVQLFSNTEPDIRIMHVGPMYISQTASDKLEETLAPMGVDCNDDGEVTLNLLDITINKFGAEGTDAVVTFDHNSEGYKRFQTEMRAGDSIIYLLDEAYFNICLENGVLTPFEEIIDDAYMPENVISGCGVKISELDAYKLEGLCYVPESAILCIRRSPKKDDISYGRTQEVWEANRITFVNIIKYKG